MTCLCNLDGSILPESEAHIPVLDRGFLFGDSVYEVTRTRGLLPFAWPEHFERLRSSADAIQLDLDLAEAEVARRVAATLAAADHGDSYVRIIVTRGTGTSPNIGLDHAPGPPRWVILVRPAPELSGKPARLAIVQRLRNDRRALDPATKSGNYLNNLLALAEARSQGATDCLMANADGNITEGATSNFFARIGGVWCTPPLQAGILAGVTRRLLLELLAELGERVDERNLLPADVRGAEELFLSSTLRDVAPVTHIDGAPLHDGNPGPHTARLMAAFHSHCERLMSTRYEPGWRQLLQA
ncbi:MAG: aminotransferase class IV [Planctomycetes bacterium]|nr:aminotransferase class IV [Planctomycetota bacterium]